MEIILQYLISEKMNVVMSLWYMNNGWLKYQIDEYVKFIPKINKFVHLYDPQGW